MPERHTLDHLRNAVDRLQRLHSGNIANRRRIRNIVNGGTAALQELIGEDVDIDENDLPAANLVYSQLERFAQKLGQAPDVKVDPPSNRDSDRASDRADKRSRIVSAYDEQDRLEIQLPIMARWVPGYAFGVWVIREQKVNGHPYPSLQLRDPFSAYPGWWGPDQRPNELAILRHVPPEDLAAAYPAKADAISRRIQGASGAPAAYSVMGSYESGGTNADGWVVAEYHDITGTYVFTLDEDFGNSTDPILDFTPNLLSHPRFVIPRRAVFDELNSSFHHVLGLMSLQARLNILAAVAMEDGINTETNIIGELRGVKYQFGRHAVNEFEPGSTVSKPVSNLPYQAFTLIDRVERQFRLTSGYPVTDDAESPNSFVTGKGLEELASASSRMVQEYQAIFRRALQDADALRLEWDEKYYPGRTKPLVGSYQGSPFSESYVPSRDIDGDYRTRRVYGMMAGWDDATKIVGGLQLLQGGVIDIQTFQENLRGLDNVSRIRDRIRTDAVERQLLANLGERFNTGDPVATMAMIEILEQPGQMVQTLRKFFTPSEPEMSPQEQQMAAPMPQSQGPPPDVTTVLSRLTQAGQAQGGAQTVQTTTQPARRA